MRAQSSNLPEVREQRTTAVTTAIVTVDSAVANCMKIFEQSFEVLTTLQEYMNVEHLETEMQEMQQKYNEVKGTMQMVSLTQRVARM